MLVVLFIFFQSTIFSFAQANFVHYHCDNTYGNYTSNSTYQFNLNAFLSNISSNSKVTSGFYNFSSGRDSDTVNGIGLCRGDILLDDCRSCLKNATADLFGVCPNQKQAIGWYDNCMVRYSNRSLLGVMEISPLYWIRNPHKALDQNNFDTLLLNLFDSSLNKTVRGNSTLKFSMNMVNVSTFVTLYAFTQCTPDLSQSDCYGCLSDSISELSTCCLPYQGVRYFRPSCNIRYEVYKFSSAFDSLSNTSEPPSLPPTEAVSSPPTSAPILGKGKRSKIPKTIVVVVVGGGVTVLCLMLAVVIYLCLRRDRRKLNDSNTELEEEDRITTIATLQIAYGDIKDATQGFAEANKLGKGGFGTVYKGVLANGKEIAVKRLARSSMQGEEEFRTEVLLLAKLEHRNLVKLLGYSFEGEERLLIYEFVPNSSLDHFLFGKTQAPLEWNTRFSIIQGIARGLLYLHEDSRIRIIHRDLKASNILLDAHLNPKISDFGMARLFQDEQTHADTQRIAGTFGYMAPEYAYKGIFSIKSDTYSFGILVLEIICGKRNSVGRESEDKEDLVTSIWRNWREGTALEIVDSELVSASRAHIMRCIRIGLLCVQADPAKRPTMSLVNLMLSSDSHSMPVPTQPAYVMQRSMSVDSQSITELYPR